MVDSWQVRTHAIKSATALNILGAERNPNGKARSIYVTSPPNTQEVVVSRVNGYYAIGIFDVEFDQLRASF